MMIIYRLDATKRTTDNNYAMIGDNSRGGTLTTKTIGFNGKHTQLMVGDGGDKIMLINKFPKTSPLTQDKWHCLCIKWVADEDSSIWVNARKIY